MRKQILILLLQRIWQFRIVQALCLVLSLGIDVVDEILHEFAFVRTLGLFGNEMKVSLAIR
jgi:hypothetical protein